MTGTIPSSLGSLSALQYMCVPFLCEGVVDAVGLWWPFGGARSCCSRGAWWALVFRCSFCGCAWELNEALAQLVAFFSDGEDGDGDGDAGGFTTTS